MVHLRGGGGERCNGHNTGHDRQRPQSAEWQSRDIRGVRGQRRETKSARGQENRKKKEKQECNHASIHRLLLSRCPPVRGPRSGYLHGNMLPIRTSRPAGTAGTVAPLRPAQLIPVTWTDGSHRVRPIVASIPPPLPPPYPSFPPLPLALSETYVESKAHQATEETQQHIHL